MITVLIALVVFSVRRFSLPYHWRWINGILISILFMGIGSMRMFTGDARNNNRWIGHHINAAAPVLAGIQETLTERPRSYKTIAKAEAVWRNGKWISVSGNIILYISKDHKNGLVCGSQVLIRKQLQPITNSGNPGGFDYRQYCASQDIYYQVFFSAADYRLTGKYSGNVFNGWLLQAREWILHILKQYIPGEKEAGVAEALLIGYRNDLDRDLVQAYSHTGVVHIIAISGLHLGMIYGLMLALLKPFRKRKWIRWVKPALIITVLWIFCLLTGAAASILRSAVMFTFIIAGESLGRKTQVYNTLAASAFCLLAYHPWFLWDAGFQLSYAAVLGILLFMKPLYRLIYCTNKLLNGIWQLNAITLSAQIFTLPLVLYYFHQFPNLFLFTNFIAVPLSGLILYGELLLPAVQGIPAAGVYTGKAVSFSIQLMNGLIERTDRLPFSVTDQIHTPLPATLALYVCIIFITAWLFLKKPFFAILSLAAMTAACCMRMVFLLQLERQLRLVVYNIPRRQAIDFISGRHAVFYHTIPSVEMPSVYAFHLKAARIVQGVKHTGLKMNADGCILTMHYMAVAVSGPRSRLPPGRRVVQLVIVSGNPAVSLAILHQAFDCNMYVFDSSNPLWKIRHWKKEADSLHLRHHSVPEQGAFIMDL